MELPFSSLSMSSDIFAYYDNSGCHFMLAHHLFSCSVAVELLGQLNFWKLYDGADFNQANKKIGINANVYIYPSYVLPLARLLSYKVGPHLSTIVIGSACVTASQAL